MYYSADGVPPLHAVMTDSYGERSSVPHDGALYVMLTVHSHARRFRAPDGRFLRESYAFVDGAAACGALASGLCVHTLLHRLWHPLTNLAVAVVQPLFSPAALAGEPDYEAVLGLGKVWVNGRLVVDPPPAAYAPREGDAHRSGIDPASVRLAELRVVAMAAAIARGASKAEAVASGHVAVAGGAAFVGEGGGAGGAASGSAAAGRAGTSRRAR
jgi:hypothetical protein